jgi:hypothetical protein
MRRPLSIVHGLATSWRERATPGAPGMVLGRVTGEVARMEALVDGMLRCLPGEPWPPQG